MPAVFSVTSDPYIVFFSNIFAIMGLRSLFFLLSNVTDMFWLLKYGTKKPFTYADLRSEYKPYSNFAAFRNHRIYTCNTLVTTYYDDITIHPWYDEKRGSYHPDLARFLPDGITLAPNGTYIPDAPFYVAAFAGKGNLNEAQKHALRVWK